MSRKSRPRIPPKELRDLWDSIPDMADCKGTCARSCGPIGCSRLERKLIEERAGRKLTTVPVIEACTMLKNGLCSVYTIRPVICRIWGVVPSLPCPEGCVPERPMSDREGYGILAEVALLSGDPDGHAIRELVNNATPEFWLKMGDHASGAPDISGTTIVNREPAARALYGMIGEMHARMKS